MLLQQYLPFTVLKRKLYIFSNSILFLQLQQYLPFTVLKLQKATFFSSQMEKVATVLTVYGIETHIDQLACWIANDPVATVLTVYGIETLEFESFVYNQLCCNSTYRLRY